MLAQVDLRLEFLPLRASYRLVKGPERSWAFIHQACSQDEAARGVLPRIKHDDNYEMMWAEDCLLRIKYDDAYEMR